MGFFRAFQRVFIWMGLMAEQATETDAINQAVVERGMPYLGICLSHQLLGAALGGRVGKMALSEVGIREVELTARRLHDNFMKMVRARVG